MYKAEGELNFGRFSPGHFYSTIPAVEEIVGDERRIWKKKSEVAGINLRKESQFELLKKLALNYGDIPFTDQPKKGLYYFYSRGSYSYSDAIFLHLMLRHISPSRIVEVGSGSSSCVMLDTNRHFLDSSMNLTFIDPFPNKMPSIPQDSHGNTELIPQRVQDVDVSVFKELQENDVLFIDSTHVSKVGSDVNDIIFRILPSLNSGVYVHFHDIFFPFEYPKNWVLSHGKYWNEIYLLRAFLQFNASFQIVIMNTFVQQEYTKFFRENMPLCLKNRGGSIWLKKK